MLDRAGDELHLAQLERGAHAVLLRRHQAHAQDDLVGREVADGEPLVEQQRHPEAMHAGQGEDDFRPVFVKGLRVRWPHGSGEEQGGENSAAHAAAVRVSTQASVVRPCPPLLALGVPSGGS